MNSYVERRSRRYIQQQPLQMEFETSVLNYVRKLLAGEGKLARQELSKQLDDPSEKTARPTPMLGLFEVKIWLESQVTDRPIRQVFEEYVAGMREANQ